MRKQPKINKGGSSERANRFIEQGGDASPVRLVAQDTDKATQGITLRLSKSELEAIKAWASEDERSIQFVLRKCVQQSIENRTKPN